jgi:hypothetical protein
MPVYFNMPSNYSTYDVGGRSVVIKTSMQMNVMAELAHSM